MAHVVGYRVSTYWKTPGGRTRVNDDFTGPMPEDILKAVQRFAALPGPKGRIIQVDILAAAYRGWERGADRPIARITANAIRRF